MTQFDLKKLVSKYGRRGGVQWGSEFLLPFDIAKHFAIEIACLGITNLICSGWQEVHLEHENRVGYMEDIAFEFQTSVEDWDAPDAPVISATDIVSYLTRIENHNNRPPYFSFLLHIPDEWNMFDDMQGNSK